MRRNLTLIKKLLEHICDHDLSNATQLPKIENYSERDIYHSLWLLTTKGYVAGSCSGHYTETGYKVKFGPLTWDGCDYLDSLSSSDEAEK